MAQASSWTLGRIITAVVGGILALVLVITATSLFVDVGASEIVVVQSPVSGKLTAYTDPGWEWQGMGSVTRYPRREQFSFSSVVDQGHTTDESILTQFNDGGHANISGTINWQMPLKPEAIIQLHKDFHGFKAIDQMLIRTAIQKVIYNVGPTMSSTESSAERRPDIPKYIDDQLVNGPYLTKTVLSTIKDPITGLDKQQNIVQIALGEDGKPMRESSSAITKYGIQLQPVTINDIRYDDTVAKQIKARQDAAARVQTATANARAAEQDAVTAAKQGEAAATKANWEQQTVNAKLINDAQAKVQIAEADVKTAQLFKQSETLRGEGEAARKKLVMEADGQLDKKLEAYVKVSEMYATAIEKAQPGAWSPSVVMGGGNGASTGGGNASNLIELLQAKTAKDLAIDLQARTGAAKK